MERVRRSRPETSRPETHNFEKGEEENTVDSANLESMEVKRGGWQLSCSLENRFAVLVNEDEEDHDDVEAPGLQNLGPQDDNDWVHLSNMKKRKVKREHKNTRNRWIRSKE